MGKNKNNKIETKDDSIIPNSYKANNDVYVYNQESQTELNKEFAATNTKDSTINRIYRYYHNNKARVVLSKEENEIRHRLEKAWFLLCRHRTQKQVAEILERLFDVGMSQAYDDIRNAMNLFSNPHEDVQDAKRAIAETWAVNGANKCWKDGDMDGYYKFLKEYKEINGISVDSNENSLSRFVKNMKPQQIIIVASVQDLQAEAKRLQEEVVREVEFREVEE